MRYLLDTLNCAPVDTRERLQAPALAPALQDPRPELKPTLHKTVELQDGSTLEIDFYQVASDWWTAKDSNHDRRCGHGRTQDEAEEDLVICVEDEIEARPKEPEPEYEPDEGDPIQGEHESADAFAARCYGIPAQGPI